MSLSAGVRGASVSAGTRGVHGNVGIPGTGVSVRERLDKPASRGRAIADELGPGEASVKVTLSLDEKGKITAADEFGEPVPAAHMRLVWDQQGEQLRNWLLEQAKEINGDVALLQNIHVTTPHPATKPTYRKVAFNEQPPASPQKPALPVGPADVKPKRPSITAKLFAKKREAFDEAELERQEAFEAANAEWRRRVKSIEKSHDDALVAWKLERVKWLERFNVFKEAEEKRAAHFDELVQSDIDTMQVVIDRNLNEVEWPRETLVSYEISTDRKTVWMDVDLPEIEDLPQKVAELAASGKRLNVKNKAQAKLRGEYASHIHGIAFLLAGLSLASLPGIDEVVISGYSQRLDKATGTVNDDYLFSIRYTRDGFSAIEFGSLTNVDPVEAIKPFEHRRKMTSTGIFKPIEPLSP